MDQGEAYLWKQRAQVATDRIQDLEQAVSDLRGVLDITLELVDEMGQYIEATRGLLYMVTLEDDNKPPSPEIAQANHLLARWDAIKVNAKVV